MSFAVCVRSGLGQLGDLPWELHGVAVHTLQLQQRALPRPSTSSRSRRPLAGTVHTQLRLGFVFYQLSKSNLENGSLNKPKKIKKENLNHIFVGLIQIKSRSYNWNVSGSYELIDHEWNNGKKHSRLSPITQCSANEYPQPSPPPPTPLFQRSFLAPVLRANLQGDGAHCVHGRAQLPGDLFCGADPPVWLWGRSPHSANWRVNPPNKSAQNGGKFCESWYFSTLACDVG